MIIGMINIQYQILSAKHDIKIDREWRDDSNGGLVVIWRFDWFNWQQLY